MDHGGEKSGLYGEESRGIGEPGLDESGEVEDDGAAGEGGDERRKVGDVAVDNFGGGRKEGKIAGGSDEDPHGVTLSEKGVTEPSPKVTRCTGH